MRLRPGAWCWVGLAGYVVVADGWLIYKRTVSGDDKYVTMSCVFEDALKHPVRRWPVVAAWLVLTTHLHDVWLPRWMARWEPVGLVGSVVDRWLHTKRWDVPGYPGCCERHGSR